MRHTNRLMMAMIAALALSAAACSSDGGESVAATTAELGTTDLPETTAAAGTTAVATTESATTETTTTDATSTGMDVVELVTALASDEMNGRDNTTAGSQLARDLLVAELSQFAEPIYLAIEGGDGFLQPYQYERTTDSGSSVEEGTNILAVIPGSELPDEYVMVGAHYDHHGNDCQGITADDNICNGANDNAAGVGVVMRIVRAIAADGAPRRSIIVALWDGEEDGLIGSRAYVEDPAIPLDQTIAYVNFDIQGANLLPSLANSTILVGAETGGPNLVSHATEATAASSLDTVMLSLLFGQGRSDHAVLVAAGVPSVFFTDANTGCYHTVKDDIEAVDFGKLEQQSNTAEALTRALLATDDVPQLDADAPTSTYKDAAQLLRIVAAAEPDFGYFGDAQRTTAEQYLVDLQSVVDAGAEAFDDDANGILLGGAVQLVTALSEVECDPFIP